MQSPLAVQLKALDPAELGRRMRSARVARGLTQTELGSPEVSAAYVSRIESGQRRPNIELLTGFAERLGVPVENLVNPSVAPDPDEVALQLNFAELALESADAEEAEAQTRDMLGRLPSSAAGALGVLRNRAYYLHARALEAQGRLEEAILDLKQVTYSGGADLQWVEARLALSRCYRETGDFGRAIECGRPAFDVLESAGLAHCDEAIQLVVTVAAAYYERGDRAEAQRLCKRAIEQAERAGSPKGRASAYWNASMIESREGSFTAAVTLAQRALALLGEGNDLRNLARLRSVLGNMQLMTDEADLREAELTLQRAADELIASSAGPVDLARNELALCKVQVLRGHLEEVPDRIDLVLDAIGEVAPVLAAEALVVLGRARVAQDDIPGARAAFSTAVATLSAVGADRSAAELWFELGALWEGLGEVEAARDAYRSAAASTGLYGRFTLPATSAPVNLAASMTS